MVASPPLTPSLGGRGSGPVKSYRLTFSPSMPGNELFVTRLLDFCSGAGTFSHPPGWAAGKLQQPHCWAFRLPSLLGVPWNTVRGQEGSSPNPRQRAVPSFSGSRPPGLWVGRPSAGAPRPSTQAGPTQGHPPSGWSWPYLWAAGPHQNWVTLKRVTGCLEK